MTTATKPKVMSVAELIDELRTHSIYIPVFLSNDYIYDDQIKVEFDSEYGIVLSSPAINSFFKEVVTLIKAGIKTKFNSQSQADLRDWLEDIGVENV